MGNALAACLPDSQDPSLRDIPSGSGGGVSSVVSGGRDVDVGVSGGGESIRTSNNSNLVRETARPASPAQSSFPGPSVSTSNNNKSSLNVKRADTPPPVAITPPTPTSAMILTKTAPASTTTTTTDDKKEKKSLPPKAPVKDAPSTKPKEEEDDFNYFQDMEPTYKKPTVIVKPVSPPASSASRLALTAEEDWDDTEKGWGDD